MESLVSYLVAAMLAWVPPNAHAVLESRDQVLARYDSIARDAVSVALDESEAPVLGGPDSRAETALLMLAVASYESSFSKGVDEGARRGDNGHSYCLMQIHVGQGATREGWSARQLIENRRLCFRAALHIMQASFAACRKLPFDDRLSAYASGHCFQSAKISRSRVWRARAWWRAHAPPRELASAS
jgi:hypothetical protein